MKFYRYPLAIVAYALLFIYGIALAWHKMGGVPVADFWKWFPIGAGIYLAVSFILTKLKLAFELDALIQALFVLGPVLWYVNQKDAYKQPIYVFIAEPEYNGPLEIHFNYEKDAPTNVRSKEDTIYFRFDDHGRMLINEAADYVKKMMKKNLFIFHPDHTKERVSFEGDGVHAGKAVVKYDSAEMKNGKLMTLFYTLHQ